MNLNLNFSTVVAFFHHPSGKQLTSTQHCKTVLINFYPSRDYMQVNNTTVQNEKYLRSRGIQVRLNFMRQN